MLPTDGANMKIVLTRSSTIFAPSWFDISSEVHYQLYYLFETGIFAVALPFLSDM